MYNGMSDYKTYWFRRFSLTAEIVIAMFIIAIFMVSFSTPASADGSLLKVTGKCAPADNIYESFYSMLDGSSATSFKFDAELKEGNCLFDFSGNPGFKGLRVFSIKMNSADKIHIYRMNGQEFG